METKIKSSKNVSSQFSYFSYCFAFRGFLLFVFFISFRFSLISQTPGEWTWMHGDNTPNALGVFGTKGVPSPVNKPPALYEACEWTDNNGNFWLFGGHRVTSDYSALWKYDPTVNQWIWKNGPSVVNQPGVYGVQGISSSANYPPARGFGAVTWVDTSGILWLFGGATDVGPKVWNDLWKYDISTNEWTWMKGPNIPDDPGSYGTQGISNPANLPPARDETSCSWTDNAGNLWLYGGQDKSLKNWGDLWSYDISINEWTWMHGANTINAPAVYGIQGTADPANTPGGRPVYCSWTDLVGNLWLFAGKGGLNDLWKYDINTNQWTWIKGPNTSNNPGNYGVKCVSTNNNIPPARMENRARVRDACGNFWNFGGTRNFLATSNFNDMWHYNVSTNQWTWVSGDNILNQAAVYGVQGVSNPANKPEAKAGSVAWIDNMGSIWIFGGLSVVSGTNYYNDLFRFVPDTNCIPSCNITFSTLVTSTTILCNGFCNGTSTAIPNNGSVPYTYSWNTIPIQTTATATGLCAGTYTVIVSDAVNSSATATVTIIPPTALTAVAASTPASCGNYNGSVTVTAAGGTPGYFYSWSPSGGTNATATGLAAGTYTAIITDANGCTQTQTVTVVSNNVLTINVSFTQTGCAVNNGAAAATPLSGTAPYTYTWSNGQTTSAVTGLGAGTYIVTVTDAGNCTQTQTVTITTLPGPIVTANAIPINISAGDSTQLTATGGGIYSWSNGATGAVTTVSPSLTTVYCVTVTDTDGCTAAACVTVIVALDCSGAGELYLPNAFSPNGDGENDLLNIYYGNIKCIREFKLVIYNRWGEKVYESDNPSDAGWNGYFKGRLEGSAVFAYYLKYKLLTGEEGKKKGNISLIR